MSPPSSASSLQSLSITVNRAVVVMVAVVSWLPDTVAPLMVISIWPATALGAAGMGTR